jgi:hypothetical protein
MLMVYGIEFMMEKLEEKIRKEAKPFFNYGQSQSCYRKPTVVTSRHTWESPQNLI